MQLLFLLIHLSSLKTEEEKKHESFLVSKDSRVRSNPLLSLFLSLSLSFSLSLLLVTLYGRTNDRTSWLFSGYSSLSLLSGQYVKEHRKEGRDISTICSGGEKERRRKEVRYPRSLFCVFSGHQLKLGGQMGEGRD